MRAIQFSKGAATRRFNSFKRRRDVIAAMRRLRVAPPEEVAAIKMHMVQLARAAFCLQLTPIEHKAAIVKLAATSTIAQKDLFIMAFWELEQMLFGAATAAIPEPIALQRQP